MSILPIEQYQFEAYKLVQESGKFNMLDARARQTTDMSKDQWIYIMKNYKMLNNLFNQKSNK
tara:strand:+ start:124 stop:309 length:186 start_codon:yes stop_codon:yes gene_type:complete